MLQINRENKFSSYLVPGGYIAQIGAVKHDSMKKELVFRFDICEGEYKGYFSKEYSTNISNGWPNKGVATYRYSDENGERFLNQLIDHVEKSNPGYTWDGDETKLKGKKVGVYYQNNTYTNRNGEEKKGTSFPKFVSVEDIRNGNFSIDETSKKKEVKSSNDFKITDDDIQF